MNFKLFAHLFGLFCSSTKPALVYSGIQLLAWNVDLYLVISSEVSNSPGTPDDKSWIGLKSTLVQELSLTEKVLITSIKRNMFRYFE